MANLMRRDNTPLTIFDLFSRPLSSFDDDFADFNIGSSFKTDIQDTGSAYRLTGDLPGVLKQDLQLDFDDGVLTISAKHHSTREETDDAGYVLKERTEGAYSRSFSFDNIDENNIDASFADGVLQVTLPKCSPTRSAKSIEIK